MAGHRRRGKVVIVLVLLALSVAGAVAVLLAKDPHTIVARSGSQGDEVEAIQEALTRVLGRTVTTDGTYLRQTLDAVTELQAQRGLTTTGEVDRTLYNDLLEKWWEPLLTPDQRWLVVAVALGLTAGALLLFAVSGHRRPPPPPRGHYGRSLSLFISYRHADPAAAMVPTIRDALQESLQRGEVFLDNISITFGDSIKETVRDGILRCNVLLAIIGDGWSPDRLQQGDDWVRFELTTAKEQGKEIVPVLIGNPPPSIDGVFLSRLPPDLLWLAGLKAFSIRTYSAEDVRKMVVHFEHQVVKALKPKTRGGVIGVARNVVLDKVWNPMIGLAHDYVLRLVVERPGLSPNIPVELRGGDVLEGGLPSDGAIVEVPDARRRSSTRKRYVLNRSTDTTVQIVKSFSRKLQLTIVGLIPVGAIVVAIVVWMQSQR